MASATPSGAEVAACASDGAAGGAISPWGWSGSWPTTVTPSPSGAAGALARALVKATGGSIDRGAGRVSACGEGQPSGGAPDAAAGLAGRRRKIAPGGVKLGAAAACAAAGGAAGGVAACGAGGTAAAGAGSAGAGGGGGGGTCRRTLSL